jgi:putative ABC transport system permease protein
MKRDEVAGATGLRGAFNEVAMTLAPGAEAPEVIAAVDRLLAPYGGRGVYGRDEQSSHRFIRDELAQDRITALVVPGVFLAVAALLIHLLLMRLVASQREQIAVLKAFGYGNAAIARHYAGFGLVIVTAGSVAGVPCGVWLGRGLTELYTRFFHFPALLFRISGFSIALSVGVTLIAALGGSLLAVRSVVSQPPAEGMRGETPARFGATWIDRSRLFRLVSPPVRMILRSLQRTPMRTLMSLLAMATAGMILVVGQYSFDALDFMIDVQFRRAQTDDATVELTQVRGERAAYALAAIPGVTRVEPIRNVAVRLRAGHRSRRVVLTGLERDARLRRLVGMHGEVTALPPSGLVMATKLAEILDLHAGDTVTVEALEAPRPTATMTVTALADEMIGTTVYASRADVNRFLREGPSLTAASLAIEPSQAMAVYTRLKGTPAIAAVSLREAMLDSFRKTIAENMRISATMIIVFASIIAFGVIYNGARIALSERGRDLASLRVLGFSRAEVGAMLLGEQAIITLASIPIGFAGGYALCLWLVALLDSEVYRLPMVISARTYGISFLVIAVAALFTAFVVQRRIGQLDLVAVLKTRE